MKKIDYIAILFLLLFFIFYGNFIYLIKNANIIFASNDKNTVEIKTLKNINYTLENRIEKINTLLDKDDSYDYFITSVIFRGYTEFYDHLTILGGNNYNIKNKMAVINSEGIIGIIDKVYENTSLVRLVSANNINLSVRINDSYGILNGYKNDSFIVTKLNYNDDVKVGDDVYTSNYSSIIENLYVGYVSEIIEDELGIEKKLIIKRKNTINSLDYLSVILYLKDNIK